MRSTVVVMATNLVSLCVCVPCNTDSLNFSHHFTVEQCLPSVECLTTLLCGVYCVVQHTTTLAVSFLIGQVMLGYCRRWVPLLANQSKLLRGVASASYVDCGCQAQRLPWVLIQMHCFVFVCPFTLVSHTRHGPFKEQVQHPCISTLRCIIEVTTWRDPPDTFKLDDLLKTEKPPQGVTHHFREQGATRHEWIGFNMAFMFVFHAVFVQHPLCLVSGMVCAMVEVLVC